MHLSKEISTVRFSTRRSGGSLEEGGSQIARFLRHRVIKLLAAKEKIVRRILQVVFVPLVIFASLRLASFAQTPDARIVRLPPAAISRLPANLVKELPRRKCTIPQETRTEQTNNVIKGEFAKPGQTDWAVLCSRKGVSAILVFWNGSEKNPASLASMNDRILIQGFRKSESSYSRGIRPADRSFITLHHNAYGGRSLPPINHQGIVDTFTEKPSVVWYSYQGKWLKLSGSD